MKKKKQPPPTTTTTTATATTTTTTTSAAVLKTLIHDSAAFFDNLVDLIPARYYLSTDNTDKPWFQGLPKSAREAAKRQSKENIKKSRRERLDPEKAGAKTTNQILRESLEAEKSKKLIDDDDDDDEEEGESDGDEDGGGKASVTYEELQERLRRKIAELRGGRGEGGSARREKREARKRKWEESKGKGKGKKSEETDAKRKRENEDDDDVEKDVAEAVKDIEFGKVKLAAGVDDGSRKKKRKLSKEKELQRALKLEEAMKDPERGEMVAKKHSWKAATERAMGIKVHDNPKLLKQSLQKEKKKHKKSVEKWKDRQETTAKMKQEKQDKRKGNIQAKLDKKKQMKIEKREKKLMRPRPGFEGRKEGYVNDNQGS